MNANYGSTMPETPIARLSCLALALVAAACSKPKPVPSPTYVSHGPSTDWTLTLKPDGNAVLAVKFGAEVVTQQGPYHTQGDSLLVGIDFQGAARAGQMILLIHGDTLIDAVTHLPPFVKTQPSAEER